MSNRPNSRDNDDILKSLSCEDQSNYMSIIENGYESDGRSVSSSDFLATNFSTLGDDDDDDDNNEDGFVSVGEEVSYILINSLPLALAFLMEYLMTVISLFIIGHLCTANELASASLAVTTYNITGLSVVEGLATSLDTFCSQAYGAQKYSKVGLYFLRCSAMIMVFSVSTVIVWWFSAPWLGILVPERDLLPKVQLYLRIMSMGIPGLILFETGKRFLQAQGHFKASTYVLSIIVPINVTLVFIFTKHFGFAGAPIGIVISQWLMPLALFLYSYYIIPDTKKCWYPLTDTWFHFKRVLSDWKPLLNLAFPGLVMIEAEYLSFEILTIMSTYFGVKGIATQTVITNVGSIAYQIPFAMGCVVSTRVANYVGLNMVKNAQTTTKACYCVGLLVGIASCIVIALFNKPLAKLFTNDEEVIKLACYVLYILAINQISDSFAVFSSAVLRGQGRHRIGGMWNIIVYYFFSSPLSGWLAFGPLHLEVAGLWYGCGIGIFTLAVIFTRYVYKSDWNVIVDEFLKREAEEYEVDLESMTSSNASIGVYSR
ncbi:Erc1p Ecym_3195 [Eremothecium cymbalariae DBVPG|uniref:Uncharacterized protein n=1 Tax=Eremothecium cymbalariae (strain CBS 270.75 / DBVPG 7215 / KCTC 17166 / NRRL Y-17582) TaxID=931890 RepID=G8JRC4_ERECY|nr:Hypothetical protein Ecym_3195 [Eremothecium cymbalariae DBVPG\